MELGIIATGEQREDYLVDGSVVQFAEYNRIHIALSFDDGTIVTAKVDPVVCVIPPTSGPAVGTHGIPVTEENSRLLGYGAMTRLGLKQDFKMHKLVKYIARV